MKQRSSLMAPLIAVVIALGIVLSFWGGLVDAGPGLVRNLIAGGAPTLINYQGRLTDPSTGQAKADGSYDMVFRVYGAETAGSPLWTGTHTAANGNPVTVSVGIFSVLLGSGSGNSLSSSLFSSPDRWIEVQISSEILSPRQRMGSVPYALQAEEAKDAAALGGLAASAFVGQGQANSVSGPMLADGSVTSAKIADGTIVNADIAPNAAISPTKVVFYGDGSAGALNVTGSSELPGNTNFTTCTIQNGATLLVPAGGTLRCNGSFVNNGTIIVKKGAPSGRIADVLTTTQILPPLFVAGPGDTVGSVGFPGVSTAAVIAAGGAGGAGLRSLLAGLQGLGVGGGGGFTTFLGDPEPSGGGLIKVLSRGSLVNAGLITANGTDFAVPQDPGSGGGGGGVVILASSTAVTNTGQIQAEGGNGSNSTDMVGPGGGGSGGLIALIAPLVSNTGSTSVGEGNPGAVVGQVTQEVRRGGGGGGGSAGAGGAGGSVPAGNPATPTAAFKGGDGVVVLLPADPATMWP